MCEIYKKMGSVFTNPSPIEGGGLYVDVPLVGATNIAVFTVMLILALTLALSEILNLHFPYSKFAAPEAIEQLPGQRVRNLFGTRISSRKGMFLIYIVPLITYLVVWGILASENMRVFGQVAPSPAYSIILLVGWCLSFSKRLFEVLFIHIYSANIPLASALMISSAYSLVGLGPLAYANQVVGYSPFSPETIVKDVICFILFFIGITVNAFSHYQLRLARMRKASIDSAVTTGTKQYLAPADIGILFRIFICPHYVFEIIMFDAWCLFGATSVHYMFAAGVTCYLGFRTRSTFKWYQEKGLLNPRRSGNQNTSLLTSAAKVGDV